MNIICISLNLGVLENKLKKESLIGFIPTAGEAYENPYFVEDSRKELIKMGYNIKNIDISNDDREKIKDELKKVDALYVAGGNVFYLMQQIKKRNMEQTIVDYINSGNLYIGASAGCAVLSPTLDPYKELDDISKAPLLESTKGLGAIDFVIMPHYGKEKYLEKYNRIIKEYEGKYKMVTLRDDEALIITNNNYKLCKSGLVDINRNK
jgi:dipeptidase E